MIDVKTIGAVIAKIKGMALALVPGAVNDWLDDHPEATTTVEDGAITLAKLHSEVIDADLDTSGAAADSKAVGDALSEQSEDIENLNSALTNTNNVVISGKNLLLNMAWEYGNINSSGENANNGRVYYARTKDYYVPGVNSVCDAEFITSDNANFVFVEYNSNGTFSSRGVYASYTASEREAAKALPMTVGKKYRFCITLPSTVTINLSNMGLYIDVYVKTIFGKIFEGLEQAKSLAGHGRVSVSQTLVNANTPIEITSFPRYLKKNHGYSFSAIIGSFTKLIIGQGYQTYRGKWLEIDNTNIVVKQYDTSESTVGTIAHGLTISEQINVSMMIDNDGKGHCVITTVGGKYQHDFNMGYEVNGNYFAIGSQNLANVVFSAVSCDIKKPLWLFGDSYLGIYDERIGGQLKNYGYINNIMIHALAGQNSSEAYTEFEKAIALGKPKFLLWALGMNDASADAYQSVMEDVKDICDANNITLILYRVPTVPSRKSICEAINTVMLATGLRYINAYRAVETDSDGNWATGTLANDGIHPTELGAQLIAQRYLVDAPEIMEYMQ